jgi:hypothetical protein
MFKLDWNIIIIGLLLNVPMQCTELCVNQCQASTFVIKLSHKARNVDRGRGIIGTLRNNSLTCSFRVDEYIFHANDKRMLN